MRFHKFRAKRTRSFEAAHQLLEGTCCKACSVIHGHTFHVTVTLVTQRLNKGMVLDFAIIDTALAQACSEFDHALIVPLRVSEHFQGQLEEYADRVRVVDFNPTAENLALEIYDRFRLRMLTHLEAGEGDRLHIESVEVKEGEAGAAEFYDPDTREELEDGVGEADDHLDGDSE